MTLRIAVAALVAALATPLAAADRVPGVPDPVPPEPCGFGAGGFPLPGTAGCLTLNGVVRAEGTWSLATPKLAPVGPVAAAPQRPGRGFDRATLGTSARLTADMRLPTELGPVRVFVSLRAHQGAATDRAAR